MSATLVLELFVNLELRALHSLEEREEKHWHTWDIEVGLKGKVCDGRVLSLPLAHDIFSQSLKPLQGTFLNENPWLDIASKKFPTCENLSLSLYRAFTAELERAVHQDIQISAIKIGVREADGTKLGYASLRLENQLPKAQEEKAPQLADDNNSTLFDEPAPGRAHASLRFFQEH